MSEFSVEDVIDLYKEMQRTKGKDAYRYVSDVLEKAKVQHRKDYLKRKRDEKGLQQSWNNVKGNYFEKLLQYINVSSINIIIIFVSSEIRYGFLHIQSV